MQQIIAMMIDAITQNQGRSLQPRDAAHRRRIRSHSKITVPFVPGRRPISRYRLHFHVDGQKVVADMHLALHFFEVEPPSDALADKPTLHIRKTNEDRIDLRVADRLL